MTTEKVLYTDGHAVTITDSVFRMKKSSYLLSGIKRHEIFIITPGKVIPVLSVLIGGALIVLGAYRLMPERLIPNFELLSIPIDTSVFAVGLGTGLFLAGILLLVLLTDRYAIRIQRSEGEKNVVVSSKREYVKRILDALNHAFLSLVSPTRPSQVG